MTSCMRNQIANLYNAVSAPVAVTRDALAEILQSVRETASLLYNRTIDNIKFGRERLKDIVEKKQGKTKKLQNRQKKTTSI